MKTSIYFPAMSKKMAIMHLWKVACTLQRPNYIILYANVPYGHVMLSSLDSLRLKEFYYNPNTYPKAIAGMSRQPLKHLNNKDKRQMILPYCIIELLIIDVNSTPYHRFDGINSLSLFSTTLTPYFFDTA